MFFSTAALTASALFGSLAHALPQQHERSSAPFTCDSANPIFAAKNLTISEIRPNATVRFINGGTTAHSGPARLVANALAPDYYKYWQFNRCKGAGVPTDGKVYGRLYNAGDGFCGTLNYLPKNSTDKSVIWLHECKSDADSVSRQLFEYDAENKEVTFVGDSRKAGFKGVYVTTIHIDNTLPKYPNYEVAVRLADTLSSKHYVLKQT